MLIVHHTITHFIGSANWQHGPQSNFLDSSDIFSVLLKQVNKVLRENKLDCFMSAAHNILCYLPWSPSPQLDW